ncbi:MAG: hypothetical protein Terrestrivirus2_49 [Terrestrivirus sp.]|uniref:Uncharacterized protein n=1 Tax=Terrestrivirus sp. TaxID=2487775 RepID=A0A3G4ZNJ1_9VIRU|nr:MAG: hypothetical protein Terrestrivirus2_49 [Terrestrivirus sp.]
MITKTKILLIIVFLVTFQLWISSLIFIFCFTVIGKLLNSHDNQYLTKLVSCGEIAITYLSLPICILYETLYIKYIITITRDTVVKIKKDILKLNF